MRTLTRVTLRRGLLATALGVLLAPGVVGGQQPAAGDAKVYPIDQVPASMQPAVNRASAVMKALQSNLQSKLMDAIATKGPAAAMDIYKKEAALLQAQALEHHGVLVGRTSHKLRNPDNAPRPWASHIVAEGATMKAADAKALVVDLGDKIGVIEPIASGDICALCHGPESYQPDDVVKALKSNYPNDKANDFARDDLRGWIWAELPKSAK